MDVIKISDKFFIEDERQKTGTPYKIQILSPAMRILEKYNYKLPVITNQKYNQYLKLVAKYAEIDKPLTSHMARHRISSNQMKFSA
jgi:site-specific recombinase XerD